VIRVPALCLCSLLKVGEQLAQSDTSTETQSHTKHGEGQRIFSVVVNGDRLKRRSQRPRPFRHLDPFDPTIWPPFFKVLLTATHVMRKHATCSRCTVVK
jgi:hypothetical protein